MAGRKIADERDARTCLAAQAKTGETLRQWARRNGVDEASLHTWQLNLSRGSGVTTGVVEVVPRAELALALRAAPVRGQRGARLGRDRR